MSSRSWEAWGCSLGHTGLQPWAHEVAALGTRACSLGHTGLQPWAHGVACHPSKGEKPRLPRRRQRQRAARQRPRAVRARAGEDLGGGRRGGGLAPRREGGRPAPAGHQHDVHSAHLIERHACEESARAEALEAGVALEQRGRRRRRRQRGALRLHEVHLCVQLGELLLDRAEEAHLVRVGVGVGVRVRVRVG
eukprot:scaffold82132_cov45-Phaeocystis_antarctica.AAC.2